MFATAPPFAFSQLATLFAEGPAVVLTGAGVSTDSGVPGYRDEAGNWLGTAPLSFQDFVRSEAARQRYWARSHAGYGRIAHALPNRAHLALANLERAGYVQLLVTQNVDRLHQKAGSERVLDLHGRLDQVVCLGCQWCCSRSEFQLQLSDRNRGWQTTSGAIRPDGDAELGVSDYSGFAVPQCERCGGILKPDVVFFGERVPPERHELAGDALRRASVLLVVGSSLMVNSGFRLVRAAEKHQVPIVVFNRGVTRADPKALAKVEGNAGVLLEALSNELQGAAGT